MAKGSVRMGSAVLAVLLLTVSIGYGDDALWGRLAVAGHEGERIKTTLFFTGQARDGGQYYRCDADPNLSLYTVHPTDLEHLLWSTGRYFRDVALEAMAKAGINVVAMSSWGEADLPCHIGWSQIAPMQSSPESHDELFAAAADHGLWIMPFIESRNDWSFREEFPTTAGGRVAPGTTSQIVDLIDRYLRNPSHPEWAERWARVYDRNGEPRYAVVLIHAASDQLGPNADAAFAEGFDRLADAIEASTGIRIGFFLDPLPRDSHAPGRFKPSPSRTGHHLRESDSLLGIQSFLPEIWMTGSPSEARRIVWKRTYTRQWAATGVPFLMDVSPGYDAHIVFPGSVVYGFTPQWQEALTSMVRERGDDGLVYNSWNGYTEAMAAVPTREHGTTYSDWLRALCALIDGME